MTRLHVSGGTVVTASGPDDRDVQIADGTVSHPTRTEPDMTLDATGCLVVPGLVNTHDHLRSLLPATRRGDGRSVAGMVEAAQRASAAVTPDDYAALTALAAARQLLAGITSAVDHVYPLHDERLVKAVATAYDEVGLRASLAYGLMTSGAAGTVPSFATQVARACAAADDVVPADRLYLAPVSLRQTSVEDYRAAVAAAERTGLPLYTHVAESVDEVERCRAEHGRRPVELLADIGFLRPGTVLVHCVHLDDDEIALLAAHGVTVAYCPSNHLRLAKGFAPVVALRAAGVRVALGVDGMTDLFTEMRQAVYSQGAACARPGALSSSAAFEMATAASLHAGEPADLFTLRRDVPAVAPLVDPVHAIVHRYSRGDVRDVVVGGRLVVRDGVLQTADSTELVARAHGVTRDLARRSGEEVAEDWSW